MMWIVRAAAMIRSTLTAFLVFASAPAGAGQLMVPNSLRGEWCTIHYHRPRNVDHECCGSSAMPFFTKA
jgi:hypothetical protein